MNNSILKASFTTLSKSKTLLSRLSNEQLCDGNIPPYHSSIGSHIRHILDFYKCIFTGIENNLVDLTNRERDLNVENDCDCASGYLEQMLNSLKSSKLEMTDEIEVIDDLGQGKIRIKYTLGSLLAQANSHTIHHYAIINYILDRLNIKMEDEDFGLNPTSPKNQQTQLN